MNAVIGYLASSPIPTLNIDYLSTEWSIGKEKLYELLKAWWYNPRTGQADLLDEFENQGVRHFDPPGETQPGNDWVLVLDDADQGFSSPGSKGY